MNELSPDLEIKLFAAGLVVLHLLLMLGNVPLWSLALSFALVFFKALAWFKNTRAPKRLEVWIASIIAFYFIYQTDHSFIGEAKASMILVIMAGAKIAESKVYRDFAVVLILCFLLLMLHLLSSQGIASLIFLLLDSVLLTQFLFRLHPSGHSLFSLKSVLKVFAFLFPLWAALFFLFPRFTVGFWRQTSQVARSGFSDEMNPGQISRIVNSDEIAFRARFSEARPSGEDLYWRGSTLSDGDGLRWKKSKFQIPSQGDKLKSSAPKQAYEIWLEPGFERWLFTLDYPSGVLPQVSHQSIISEAGGTYLLTRPMKGRINYAHQSSPQPLSETLSPAERDALLKLPASLDPQIRALAEQLRNTDPQLSIQKLKSWFIEQKFHYSLTPGPNGDNRLSTFLFQTKLGFCEHYAAAGAVLLRAMGYPARVVVGFQGGDYNALGNYYLVRNRNAHAWDEVFLPLGHEGRGTWQRLDLVGVVTPVRLSLGSEYFSAVQSGLSSQANLSLSEFEKQRSIFTRAGFALKLGMDAAEMQWLQFLSAYDLEFQQSLLAKAGLKSRTRETLFGLIAFVLVTLIITYQLFKRRKQVKDPYLTEWAKLREFGWKAGLEQVLAEGPEHFSARLADRFPNFRREIEKLRDEFVRIRYQNGISPTLVQSALPEFKNALRQLLRNLRKVK